MFFPQFLCVERQGHASDVVRSYDLYTIDGIVLLSGDGLLYEVYYYNATTYT